MYSCAQLRAILEAIEASGRSSDPLTLAVTKLRSDLKDAQRHRDNKREKRVVKRRKKQGGQDGLVQSKV